LKIADTQDTATPGIARRCRFCRLANVHRFGMPQGASAEGVMRHQALQTTIP
jgi:hypothetical protein